MKHAARVFLVLIALLWIIPFIGNSDFGIRLRVRGSWIAAGDYDGNILFDEYPATITLSRNGEGTIDSFKMTWTIDGDQLIIVGWGGTERYYFKESANRLILSLRPYSSMDRSGFVQYRRA